jgi:hypothetical protein
MGYFKIITAILIWSSLGIFVRKIDLPNIGIIFYPAVIAGSIQLLSLFSTGQIKGAVKVNNNPQNTPVFLHEKILKKAWYAIILSSIGLWFILGMPISGGTLSFSDSERLGIIAGVLSGLAYALLIIMIRQIASKFSTLFIICMQNCLVVLILLPFVYTIPLTVQSLQILSLSAQYCSR